MSENIANLNKSERVTSFSAFDECLTDLENLVAAIKSTATKAVSVFENQSSAWDSANSRKEVEKMLDYIQQADTTATNISILRQNAANYSKETQGIDAE